MIVSEDQKVERIITQIVENNDAAFIKEAIVAIIRAQGTS